MAINIDHTISHPKQEENNNNQEQDMSQTVTVNNRFVL